MTNFYDKHKFISKKRLAELAGVEAEKTAVFLSGRCPQCHGWASGGRGEVQRDKLRALSGGKDI